MMRIGYLSIFLLLCCTACCPKTTVILLPDGQEASGAVTVTTDSESTTLDTPYQAASIGANTAAITVQRVEREVVEEAYGDSLQALPQRSHSFILYFITGSTELTEPSKRELENIIAQVRKTDPPIVLNIIGHTDATGSKAFNKTLSLDRARAVEALLRSGGTLIENIRIQSFGENDPLVPTPDGVPEPRNRRVEVMVL